jgi:hypothetical protein
MIAKVIGAAAAAALLALNISCAQTSKSSPSAQTSRSSAGTSASGGATGASGPEAMGRGRCEALTGAEREKCFAEERGQRSDARK